jgi:NADPH:quinone reductase-like Zn-dependent oxidoreductase
MKAMVCRRYGPLENLRLEEMQKPVPEGDQVLVQVCASSVNFNALVMVQGKPFMARVMGMGFLRPKNPLLGDDVAGKVVEVGKNVTQFRPGDEVFACLARCGCSAFAEFVCVPENVLALKPANASFEEGAVSGQAAMVALQALRDKGKIQKGQKVLIYGASGGIGTFAVQMAKAFGAEVTAVCGPKNLDLVRSLGADHVIDYTKEDFAARGQTYDLILATRGDRSIFDYRRALAPQGRYVVTGANMKGRKGMKQILQASLLGRLLSRKGGKSLMILSTRENQDDLVYIKGLIEAGKVKPVVDRRYDLSELVDALRYYDGGHARGKVAITIRGQ